MIKYHSSLASREDVFRSTLQEASKPTYNQSIERSPAVIDQKASKSKKTSSPTIKPAKYSKKPTTAFKIEEIKTNSNITKQTHFQKEKKPASPASHTTSSQNQEHQIRLNNYPQELINYKTVLPATKQKTSSKIYMSVLRTTNIH